MGAARERFHLTKRRVLEQLGGCPVSAGLLVTVPQGAFTFWRTSSTGIDSHTFAESLLEEARVAVAPGRPSERSPRIASDCRWPRNPKTSSMESGGCAISVQHGEETYRVLGGNPG